MNFANFVKDIKKGKKKNGGGGRREGKLCSRITLWSHKISITHAHIPAGLLLPPPAPCPSPAPACRTVTLTTSPPWKTCSPSAASKSGGRTQARQAGRQGVAFQQGDPLCLKAHPALLGGPEWE